MEDNIFDKVHEVDLEKTMKDCLKELHGNMDGLSLHYYVHPEGWEIKGSATDFDDKVWYKSLNKAP